MEVLTPRAELKAQLEYLLSLKYEPDDPIRPKIESLAQELYKDASSEELEDVADRIDRAFKGKAQGVHEGRRDDRKLPVHRKHRRAESFWSIVTTGVFAKYMEILSELEAPPQYNFACAATVVAAGLGRRPRIDWAARATFPNLFTLLVGESGARKGTAIEWAERIVVPAVGANLLPNEGTAQGFHAALRARLAETGGVSADGLIIAPEFSVFMGRDRNKEGLVQWITNLHDGVRHDRALKGDIEQGHENTLDNVCLTIIGGSNMPWLKTMPEDAITGGFLPRAAIFDSPEDEVLWKSRPRVSTSGVNELKRLFGLIVERGVPDFIAFDDDAGEALDTWYEVDIRRQYETNADSQYRKWLKRKQAVAMKLAVIWQLTDGGPKDKIAKEWMELAIKVVDWGDAAVTSVYSELGMTPDGQVVYDVLSTLEHWGGSARRQKLVRKLRHRYSASKVNGALNTLRQAGKVKQRKSATEGIVWEVVDET